MNTTSQPEGQHAANSLSNALGGEETAIIAGYQSSHMIHIPQTLYVPRPYEANFKKEDSLLFNLPGLIGITLDAALRYNGPKAWETESVDCFMLAKKITIRVLWPGYCSSDLQVSVRDDTRDTKPLTKSRLACNVARAIDRIIKEQARLEPSIPGYEQWIIDSNVTAARIIMTELRHVSKGSWQPVLYIIR